MWASVVTQGIEDRRERDEGGYGSEQDGSWAERLAACVQLIGIESHYSWKNERMSEPEVMLVAKTRAVLFERVIARIKALHPYETPEIVAQDFRAGFAPYLDWIKTETSG